MTHPSQLHQKVALIPKYDFKGDFKNDENNNRNNKQQTLQKIKAKVSTVYTRKRNQ
ncbi:28469_t:CDS:1, partial [Dentiscutata erythropus]